MGCLSCVFFLFPFECKIEGIPDFEGECRDFTYFEGRANMSFKNYSKLFDFKSDLILNYYFIISIYFCHKKCIKKLQIVTDK